MQKVSVLLKSDGVFTESEGDPRGLKNKRTGDSVKKSCSRSKETISKNIFHESITSCKLAGYVSESRGRGSLAALVQAVKLYRN